MNQKPTLWILDSGIQPGVSSRAWRTYESALGRGYRLKILRSLKEFEHAIRNRLRCDLMIAETRLKDGCLLSFVENQIVSSSPLDEPVPIPFLIVSSDDQVTTLRRSYRIGALDCLVKPFKPSQLLVKVERALARSRRLLGKFGLERVELDLATLSVSVPHASIRLTAKQAQIYCQLERASEAGVTRQRLLKSIWGDSEICPKALDVHLVHLRKKLTKLGLGIRFVRPDRYILIKGASSRFSRLSPGRG